MNGLFQLLYDGLPVRPSETLPSGYDSRGWTLQPDWDNGNAMRFDWIHGSSDSAQAGSTPDQVSLREDVLSAAARIANRAGFRVSATGVGLSIAAPLKDSTRNR